jgi:hypothetical protein
MSNAQRSTAILPAGADVLPATRGLIQQAGCPLAPQAGSPVLRYNDEKFLAGETGAVFLFVV